jgi:hypothetical protein
MPYKPMTISSIQKAQAKGEEIVKSIKNGDLRFCSHETINDIIFALYENTSITHPIIGHTETLHRKKIVTE